MPPVAAQAPRSKEFLLARPEARALTWIAQRLPGRVMPDHMTALGVVAALGIVVAYFLSRDESAWLWVASGLLVVHWLGDSLDGTLARVRGIQRPRYGYYLDHLVDAVATACIGIGLGLSANVSLVAGLLVVVAYLVLSINTYLETSVFGTFRLGYGRVGPTEARVALICLNAVLALTGGFSLDVPVLVIAGLMLLGLAARAARNLRELAAAEPAGRPYQAAS